MAYVRSAPQSSKSVVLQTTDLSCVLDLRSTLTKDRSKNGPSSTDGQPPNPKTPRLEKNPRFPERDPPPTATPDTTPTADTPSEDVAHNPHPIPARGTANQPTLPLVSQGTTNGTIPFVVYPADLSSLINSAVAAAINKNATPKTAKNHARRKREQNRKVLARASAPPPASQITVPTSPITATPPEAAPYPPTPHPTPAHTSSTGKLLDNSLNSSIDSPALSYGNDDHDPPTLDTAASASPPPAPRIPRYGSLYLDHSSARHSHRPPPKSDAVPARKPRRERNLSPTTLDRTHRLSTNPITGSGITIRDVVEVVAAEFMGQRPPVYIYVNQKSPPHPPKPIYPRRRKQHTTSHAAAPARQASPPAAALTKEATPPPPPRPPRRTADGSPFSGNERPGFELSPPPTKGIRIARASSPPPPRRTAPARLVFPAATPDAPAP